jgi:hypothetical protein
LGSNYNHANHCGIVINVVPTIPNETAIHSDYESFSLIKMKAIIAPITGPVVNCIVLLKAKGIKATAPY